MQIDENAHVIDFYEKPKSDEILNRLHADSKALEKWGFSISPDKPFLGSMGIYVFKREALLRLLQEDQREDFGKHLIPTQIKKGKVASFLYTGYWEDIGTIDAFYKANLALTEPNPLFDCYDPKNKIYTEILNLPGPKFSNTKVSQAIICEGSIVEADEVTHSILGPRTVIKKGTIVRNSFLMGNDFYEPPVMQTESLPEFLHIGENCEIDKCIIDRNVHIGNNVKLTNPQNLEHYNGEKIYIRDGIIIVTRGARIPDGFKL
jgi:glucose-1-phosphate adenylyltransferase